VQTTAQPTLLDVLSPRLSRPAAAGRDVALAIAGSLLLTLSAKLQIPFWPVPMTMQTFVVLVLGTAFGWRLGAATVALYLLEGALGLPVFGLAYMMGPTGGYLAGFLAAAVLCGRLAERGWDRDPWRTALAMTMSHLLILFLGWAWLAALIGPQKAYLTGVAPFYAATVAKTLLAVVALPLAWKLAGRRR
jgi:biotin transport system substrate-specific component